MQTRWVALFSLAALTLAGGILLAALVGRDAAPPAPPAARDDLSAELAGLREALERERDAGRQLAEEVARLRSELALLAPEEPGDEAGAPTPPVSAPGSEAQGEPGDDAWFDSAALLEQGLPSGEIERLRQIHAEHQLELLYLRDRAAREGYAGRPRAHQERRGLEATLREELGESDYDWLLYATGQPNRLVLDGVLDGSPAERAGLRSGDVIVRYDDRAIFRARELLTATAGGSAGASVPIEVLRDDSRLRFFVPRGPMGVRMRPERRAPGRPW